MTKLLKTSFFVFAAALVTVLNFSACSTVKTAPERGSEKVETASLLPVPSGRGSQGDQGLFLAYEIRGGSSLSESGCRLRVMELSTRKSTLLNVKPSAKAVYASVAPGRYEAVSMGCSITRVYDLKQILPGVIEVRAGHASYAGKLNFIFEGKDLTEVQRAPRAEIASSFNSALSVVPDGMTVISGYSLAPLSADMAGEGASSTGWDVQAVGVKSGPALDALLANLRKCETQAGDPLRFGTLNYKANYNAGKFSGFKSQTNTNAFPETFRACVSSVLSSFRPAVKGPVEISVVY